MKNGIIVLTSHMRKFLAPMLQIIPVLGLDRVLNCAGNRVVGTEHRTLHQLDFTRPSTLQTSTAAAGYLSLTPGLGRTSIAAAVW